MKHLILIITLSCATAGVVPTQKAEAPPRRIDWAKLFEGATVRDPTTNDDVREQMTEHIVPRLVEGAPEAAEAEIPPLVVQLNRSDPGIRLQASAVLFVLARFRPDSETVLAGAFAALMDHVKDSATRVRTNAVSTLCALRPGIPEGVLEFLTQLMKGPDELLARGADFGVARMADLRADAADSLDKVLSQTDSVARKIDAIQGISAAHVTNRRLVSRLGDLLADPDQSVVHAALVSIRDLGLPAITSDLSSLTHFAETSSNEELVGLAQHMIELSSHAH